MSLCQRGWPDYRSDQSTDWPHTLWTVTERHQTCDSCHYVQLCPRSPTWSRDIRGCLDAEREQERRCGGLVWVDRNCTICIKERANSAEPSMPSEFPERPWQKVGADLFTLNNSNYVHVEDYYSRFVEIAKLTL